MSRQRPVISFTRPPRAFALAAIAMCAVLGLGSGVRAQTSEATPPATYRELIDDALREYAARHFPEARALFERAHALWPNARTLRGLGKVSFELRRYRDAVTYLEQALQSQRQPLDAAMRADAERVRDRARGYLTQIHVLTEPAATMLVVDGAIEALSAAKLLELDPGAHTVEFRAAGFRTEHRKYELLSGQETTWLIQLEPEPPALASTAPTPAELARAHVLHQTGDTTELTDAAPGRAWLLPAGLTVSFVGVATLGAGAGFLASYYESGEHLRRAAPDAVARYEARFVEARSRALWTAAIGSGVLALGVAAFSDSIAPPLRSWLSPALLALGAGALVTGLTLYAANGCTTRAGQSLQACSASIERRDTGSLLAALSAPLLTIPVVHAVEWLLADK